MNIDPRLEEIDDSLYRVAVRALIISGGKMLAVKEVDGGGWWAISGGGVHLMTRLNSLKSFFD